MAPFSMKSKANPWYTACELFVVAPGMEVLGEVNY
jgi:hypothetical protein